MSVGVELKVAYSGFEELKDAVRIDLEQTGFRRYENTACKGSGLNGRSLEILDSGENPDFETVEYVLDYMHKESGTTTEIARGVLSEQEDLDSEENIQALIRDLEKKGFVQNCDVTMSVGRKGRRQISLLRDQDSVDEYTKDTRFVQKPKSNAETPFTAEQESKYSWEEELE